MNRVQIHFIQKYGDLVLKSTLTSSVHVKLRLTLPSTMMPAYWKRHELSAEDVGKLLDHANTRDIWLLAIAVGAAELAPSCFKIAYSTPQDILITSKAATIRKIITKFEPSLSRHNKIQSESIPPFQLQFPMIKHYVSVHDAERLRNNMLPGFNLLHITPVSKPFEFLEQSWIALRLENDYILAMRVLQEKHYLKLQRREVYVPKICLKEQPECVYCLILDDMLIFATGYVEDQV